MPKQPLPKKIRKRDGSLIPFNKSKIADAIRKAALEVVQDYDKAKTISGKVTPVVLDKIRTRFKNKPPEIETVQDVVEASLMQQGYSHLARSYILHRQRHADIRFAKAAIDVNDDLKLSLNAMEVLKRRYLIKDDNQNIIETPSELFRRVASYVAKAQIAYHGEISADQAEEKFYQMMRQRDFLPNSPTLMNTGTPLGQLSACFVLPLEDSIDGIFEALGNMAKIHQSGGGTGFSFSSLRPKNALVSSTKGCASGPVSFMKIFDQATGVIVQGGRRRGANMAIIRCDHPDIIEFVEAKMQKNAFENFNLSVAATDRFIADVKAGRKFSLKHPATGRNTSKINARELFDLIVNAAWHCGDPGLVFIDEVNRKNPTPAIGKIEATNPCGELPLLPFESCNLGSINLANMVKDGSVDWNKLKHCIHWGIRFLDNVIDMNKYPLPQIREITLANRKIGLGVMGFADMLIQLGISYNSTQALNFAETLMRSIHTESLKASANLAEERNVFPNFKRSIYAKKNIRLRNATVNTIAPTGTISIIAGCSSGIEPLFAISFVRNVLSGSRLVETNTFFEEIAKKRRFHNKEIIGKIARLGSLQNLKEIPSDIKKIFVTAFDVTPSRHLQIQAGFQKYTDNAVSKTINLPENATLSDVRRIYLQAHKLKCKGITVYRYATKQGQVLSFASPAQQQISAGPVTADAEYAGGCITGICSF